MHVLQHRHRSSATPPLCPSQVFQHRQPTEAPSWWASTVQLAQAPSQDYHSYTHTLLGVAKAKVSWVLATLL